MATIQKVNMGELSILEEKAIICLAFDEPEFLSHILPKIKNDYFSNDECKFLFTIINFHHDKNGAIPSRELVRDTAARHLTVDDPNYKEILSLCNYRLNPRDYTHIKENLISWLKRKAYGIIYSDTGINAYESGDFSAIEKIIEDASKIQDVGSGGMWFFNNLESLFDEHIEEKYTTGFKILDSHINEGGPTRGDVLLFMAPTGHGKSIAIINNAVACIKMGLNVLHVTCELSEWKTAERYYGVFSKMPISTRFHNKDRSINLLGKLHKTYGADLAIYEFPPDDISVDTIMALIDHLNKSRGWKPDVIAIDYLELMLSRNEYFNRDDYARQKKVATEIRMLAKKTQCYVISATQTNRNNDKSSGESDPIDVNRVAESYGKMMPVDYVVSINQTRMEYSDETPRLRLYIAKNRNGPKFKTLTITVDYSTMIMEPDSE